MATPSASLVLRRWCSCLNALVNLVVRDADAKQRFAAMGAKLTESAADGCAAMVQGQLPFWGKMFSDLGIKPE